MLMRKIGLLMLLFLPPILVLELVEALPSDMVAVVLLVASPFMGLVVTAIFFWWQWKQKQKQKQS